jgi:hypothetical protein
MTGTGAQVCEIYASFVGFLLGLLLESDSRRGHCKGNERFLQFGDRCDLCPDLILDKE